MKKPFKVCIVAKNWGTKGGIETVAADISRVFLDHNCDVKVCVTTNLKPSDRLFDARLKLIRIYPKIRLLRRLWHRFLSKHFNNFLVSYHTHDVDLVVVTHLNLLPSCVGAKSAKVWVWLHGLEAWGKASFINKYSSTVDALICVSEFTQKHLGQGLIVPSVVVYNSIDVDKFKTEREYNQSELNIMTCGRIIKGRPKGHRTLLKSAQLLLDQGVCFNKLYIVGDGNDRPDLESMASELGLLGKVVFVGEVSHSELLEYYKKSDIFVLLAETSLEKGRLYGEGLGVVCLEAAAFGLPVITSDFGGTAETVIDQRTGFLVPCSDVAICTEKLKLLLEDNELRKSYGSAAREFAATRFAYKNFKESVVKLLNIP